VATGAYWWENLLVGKIIDNGILLARMILLHQNQLCNGPVLTLSQSCFVVVPVLTIFFFFIHEREDTNGILFDNSLLLQTEFESVAMVCFVGVAGAVAILTIFFF
jgi:hypothetical protein